MLLLYGLFEQKVMDMISALKANGFSTKQIFSSLNWHKVFDQSYNEEDYEPTKPEIIFHHAWLWDKDTLQIIPDINLYRKRRGAPGGPGLLEMPISDI